MVPADQYFTTRGLRQGPTSLNVIVYGPPHLFRSAWLAGARDYLREPWEPAELVLRLRGPVPSFLTWNCQGEVLSLEGQRLTAQVGGSCRLSSAEAAILRVLVLRRGLAVSRVVLAWDAGCAPGRVVDTLVGRLRGKIQGVTACGNDPIASVRGIGYRLP